MKTIWLKTKYDTEIDMEIPHSQNFANAMYGFMEMGARIERYHKLQDIYDRVKREDIVLDYIDQCNTVFNKFGVSPYIPDYPEVLSEFLGRKIWHDSMNKFSCDEKKWSAGYFVKPVKEKTFTGHVIRSISDLMGCGSHCEDYEILVSDALDIAAEWRVFILYDRILDVRPYRMILDSNSYRHHFDPEILDQMVSAFTNWEDRPMACSMDICCTKDSRTLLVEMNDAYALGCYGLNSVMYARFISARWSQLLGVEDEFKF